MFDQSNSMTRIDSLREFGPRFKAEGRTHGDEIRISICAGGSNLRLEVANTLEALASKQPETTSSAAS